MKIVVCIKQVPDTKGGVKFNPDGTLDRGAMLTIMNPDDKAGLEAALRLKDKYDAVICLIGGLAGALSTAYLLLSFPAIIAWKIYRRIKFGYTLYQ